MEGHGTHAFCFLCSLFLLDRSITTIAVLFIIRVLPKDRRDPSFHSTIQRVFYLAHGHELTEETIFFYFRRALAEDACLPIFPFPFLF